MFATIYYTYDIVGKLGIRLNRELILEKTQSVIEGEINCTNVTKYSASKFLFV